MPSPSSPIIACLLSVACLLAADRLDLQWGRVLAKLAASTSFVLLALSLGALHSGYGRLIVSALMLGWLGDALLLSRQSPAFLGGLTAFLVSHALFAAAFLLHRVSVVAMVLASAVAVATGLLVIRWLQPYLPARFKVPVQAYVIVILVMCVAAAGCAASTGRWIVLIGALLFAASDVSVARDRFVKRAFVNRLWGWPTYFAAQLLLTLSVAPVR